MSFCQIFKCSSFITSAVNVSFINGICGLLDTFLIFRGAHVSISWFRDQLYNFTKSLGELQSPWHGMSIRISLLRRLMLLTFVFLYYTCFIVVTLDGIWSIKWMRFWSGISDPLHVSLMMLEFCSVMIQSRVFLSQCVGNSSPVLQSKTREYIEECDCILVIFLVNMDVEII